MAEEAEPESRAQSAALFAHATPCAPSKRQLLAPRTWLAAVRAVGPLGLLCLVAGSRWLLDEAVPEARSTAMSAGWGCFAGALILTAWLTVRRLRGRRIATAAMKPTKLLASIFFLVGPAVGGVAAGRHISGNTATLALALTPAVAAVAVSAWGASGEVAGLLWPGLAGLAGLLLLLPQPDLGSWRFDLVLAALPLVVGVGGAVAGRVGIVAISTPAKKAVFRDEVLARLALSLVLAAAVFFVVSFGVAERSVMTASRVIGSAADGFISLVSLVVLLRLGTMRWSAQFLLTPLVTILEGVLLLRPTVTARSWTGIGLLAIGGTFLLLRAEDGLGSSVTGRHSEP